MDVFLQISAVEHSGFERFTKEFASAAHFDFSLGFGYEGFESDGGVD